LPPKIVSTAKGSAADTMPAVLRDSDAGAAVAPTLLTQFEWLYTKHAGMWYPEVAPGDAVKESEQIGTVADLFGDTLENVNSSVNGVVLFLTINPSVLENGLLMGIGVE
jgi:predicted deacylase